MWRRAGPHDPARRTMSAGKRSAIQHDGRDAFGDQHRLSIVTDCAHNPPAQAPQTRALGSLTLSPATIAQPPQPSPMLRMMAGARYDPGVAAEPSRYDGWRD